MESLTFYFYPLITRFSTLTNYIAIKITELNLFINVISYFINYIYFSFDSWSLKYYSSSCHKKLFSSLDNTFLFALFFMICQCAV